MSNNKETKYTWNDFVFINKDAPARFHPGETGVICGMSEIKFEEIARKYHSKIDDWIYTVEFSDGSSIEVPEAYLEKYKDLENGITSLN